ncbi:Cytochrome P450, E-class, group I [Parasponia andersonii]|uniref:Cytochrome P450, E-class, group I n=1 Tax=Parasponia andersonii TaxID=3476 RepID=A0A2P5DDY4_PARAD|nr:Cytochrome P450, E-class, group I [Parasponia andersonii]
MANLNLAKEDLLFLVHNYYGTIVMVAVFSIGATFFISKAWTRTSSTENSQIPGQLGLPFIGETLSFLAANNSTKGNYEFVRLRRLWHGKWFKTRIFGQIHVFVPSTEGAKIIFSNDFVHFNKGYVKSMADAAGANSMFSVPLENHKRIRRLLSDPFSMNALSDYVQKFDKMLCKRLKKLEEERKSFVLLDFCTKITCDSICNMLMSVTDESLLQNIGNDCSSVSDATISFPFMIPGTRYYKGIKARQRLLKTYREIIDRRRSGKEASEDFLQSMLERDSLPPNEKLSDAELMDNLLTMIISGETTTAAAMMWSVKFLDENREVQDKLREEQLSIARNKPVEASLTLDDISKMSYGWKVAKETLRMSNIVLWYPRVVLSDCKIEGHEIRKGWYVNVDATRIHYDPDLYPNPMKFNPSRFDEIQKPYSFIPFGAGPRTCIGINLAKLTMLVFLHRLTSGYKWTVDNMDTSLDPKGHIPRLRSGCPVSLRSLKDGR